MTSYGYGVCAICGSLDAVWSGYWGRWFCADGRHNPWSELPETEGDV